MPASMLSSTVKVLVPTGTAVAATGFSAPFTLPLVDSLAIFINASAASGTTPTLDAALQTTVDGGTTWITLPIKWTQLTGVGQAFVRFQPTMGLGEAASAGVSGLTGAAQAQNIPYVGPQFGSVLGSAAQIPTMRLAYTTTGTTPNFTIGVYAILVSKGNTVN